LFGTPQGSIGPSLHGTGEVTEATRGILGKLGLTKGGGSLMPTVLGGITAAGLMTYFLQKGKTEEEAMQLAQDVKRGKGLGLDLIKADIKKYRTGDLSSSQMFDKGYHFLTPRDYIGAKGGRVGYAEGPKKMNQDGLEFIVPVGQSQEKAFYDAIINDVDGIMSDERKSEWLKLLVPQLIESGEMSREEKDELGMAQGGRIGYQPGGPAGGASAGGDYGGNVNPEQEYAGRTFQETYGGDGSNQGDGVIEKLGIDPIVESQYYDLGYTLPTGKVGVQSLSKIGKIQAMIDLKNLIEGEDIESEISYQNQFGPLEIGAKFDTEGNKQLSAMLNKGNWSGGFSTDFGGNKGIGFKYSRPLGRIGKFGGGMGVTMPSIPTGMPRVNAGGIRELDYRQSGGFVPMGVKEKADDVPAMLSKNEFVMTADAVKAAGGGSVEKGAQRMYDTMKRLEGKIA